MQSDHEEIFREGLGYFASPEMRPTAIDLINEYSADKKWVGCDCRPQERFMPQLWPVQDKGFRRDLQEGKVEHSDGCDFNQEPHPAKTVRASFQPKSRVDGILKFRLAKGFREEEKGTANRRTFDKVNRSTPRPGLARMLCELLTEAKVQEIGNKDHFASQSLHDDMVKSIKAAAENIEIADGRLLSDWISVGLKEFPSLKHRISKERMEDWGGARPHGILLCNFKELHDRSLAFGKDTLEPLPVVGRIAVFGERDASEREPYLAICLIGSKDANARYPEVLRVYAHPCLNWAKWTLVDSKLERETVSRMQSVRFKLSKERVEIRITKPLFDVNKKEPGDDEPVCIPDFLVEILSKPKAKTVVVETMGYKDDRYRNRKKRLRPYFEKVDLCKSGEVAQIEYHDPFLYADEQRSHRAFWSSFYGAVR